MKEKYKILKTKEFLKIYIKGLLHLYIEGEVKSFQSWLEGNGKENFFIEFSTKKQTFQTGYDNFKTWSNLLKELDKIFK